MDIIKNPVVVGVIAGLGTYIYLKYNSDKKNLRIIKKNKTNSKKIKLDEVNLMIPLLVSIIVWFITYAYLESSNESSNKSYLHHEPQTFFQVPNMGYKFTRDILSESSDPKSFSLLVGGNNNGHGLTVPQNLPMQLVA